MWIITENVQMRFTLKGWEYEGKSAMEKHTSIPSEEKKPEWKLSWATSIKFCEIWTKSVL